MAFQLSLKKKSSDQPATAPLWHPNFRNFEQLPDTKVVRTAFFVNVGAIAVALSLVLWLGYSEYQLHNLAEQIAAAQAAVDKNSKQNAEALRLSKQFADEEKKLTEAGAFVRGPIKPSEFVVILGQSLPKEISIEAGDMRLADVTTGPFCVLRGLAAGTPDQASGAASSYLEALRAHPRLAEVFESVNLTSLTRDPTTGFLFFEIVLKVKSADAKGKKS